MTKYAVNGSFSYQGKENLFTGLFNIDNDIITGSISDDDGVVPRHDIEGNVEYAGEKEILNFTKKPTGTALADIFYRAEKIDGVEGIAGEYEGFWSFGDQNVMHLGIGYDPKIGERAIVIPENERQNKTKMKLSEI